MALFRQAIAAVREDGQAKAPKTPALRRSMQLSKSDGGASFPAPPILSDSRPCQESRVFWGWFCCKQRREKVVNALRVAGAVGFVGLDGGGAGAGEFRYGSFQLGQPVEVATTARKI